MTLISGDRFLPQPLLAGISLHKHTQIKFVSSLTCIYSHITMKDNKLTEIQIIPSGVLMLFLDMENLALRPRFCKFSERLWHMAGVV